MTKFEPCAKGDRRGRDVAPDVLLDDSFDVPNDGFLVDARTGALRNGERRATDDDELGNDRARVERAAALASTTGCAARRVFVDVEKTIDGASERLGTVVIEFVAHESDSKSNGARAMDWFDAVEEHKKNIGESYEGSAVRVVGGGKVVTIASPIAFRGSEKTKRETNVGEATSRDVWLEDGDVVMFLGARASHSNLRIPASALYLGKVSETSFLAFIDDISRHMDCFVGAAADARVGMCGFLVDQRGATAEKTLLDMNRKRVREERARTNERRETEDATRKRLERESKDVSDRVRDAVSYAEKSNKKARAAKPPTTCASKGWNVLALGQESLCEGSSSSDEA
jgi:hypothetical protein